MIIFALTESDWEMNSEGTSTTPTRWERLLQLVSLFLVIDNECVQIAAAADLELSGIGLADLLDLHSYTTTVSERESQH